MRKQLICSIFLFFVCLLMPSMAMAEVTLGHLSRPEFPSTVTTVDSITFTVEALEDGSPVSGQSVTFSVSPNDGLASVSPTSATTDSNGQAQTTLSLSGNSSESHYKVSAKLANGLESAYWIPVGTVSDGAKLNLYLNQSRTYNAGESVGFTFSLRKGGTGVSGKTVTFSVSPNDGTASLSTTSATTDTNGSAQTKLVLGSGASGKYTVTATLDDGTSESRSTGSVHNPNPTLQSPDFYLSMLIRAGAIPVNPGESRTFIAIAQRNENNEQKRVSGKTVTFSVSPNDGTVSLSTTSATTDSNGEASTTLITGSGSSGSYTVTASGGPRISISGTVTVVGSSSPPPTDPNPDPPVEINPPPEVVQISQEQQTAPEGPTGNTDAPEGSTGNTSPTPGGSTGNTQGTPPSGTTNKPTGGTTAPVDLSDLVASIPVVSKTVLDSGESFTISVSVENTGESLSPEAVLRYYRSSGVGKSGTEVGQKTLSPIAALGTSDVSIELSAPDTSGTYLYYACISSVTGASSTGSTCTPNSVELTVRGVPQDTSEPQDTPDPPTDTKQKQPSAPVKPSGLGVSIPVISKTVLDSGESFTLSVTVENTGGSLSPETTLKYYRSTNVGGSGTEVGKKTVSPIAALGTSDVSIELTAPDAPGTYLYYACISSVTGEGNTGSTCTPNSVELTVRGVPQDTPGAPPVVGMQFTAAQIDDIEAQIELLAAKNDRSPAARQTLAYLRSLIAMARPEKTQLLANYPNPFNPETWIPYQLAVAANVTVTIYDLNGQVVRRLALGHQAAGIYQSRSRAVYWDGKNQIGESVASGLYFYTLSAGDFTATRKMLIRK